MKKPNIYFLLIILLGLALRLYGITWGLPNTYHAYSYHPDEARLLIYMANINPVKLDFNPDDFAYPTLHVFILGAAIKLVSFTGLFNLVPDMFYYANHPDDFAMIFLVGRIITLLMSLGSIWLIYKIGEKLYNKKIGLIASFILTIIPIHVIDSHYMTLDIPMLFWMLATMISSVYILKNGKTKYYIISGICLGFATATKYPALVALLSIISAHIMRNYKSKFDIKFILSLFDKKLLFAALATIVAFIIGVPYSIIEPQNFINNFITTLKTSSGGINIPLGFNLGIANWGHGIINYPYIYQIFAALPFVLGIPLYLTGIYSIFYLLRKDKLKKNMILFSTFIVYFIIIGKWTLVFQRYYLPLVALFSIFIGVAYERLNNKLVKYLGIIVIIYTLLFTITFLYKFNDTIDDSYKWIYDSVEENSTIATTLWAPLRYTPLLDKDVYKQGKLDDSVIKQKRLNNLNFENRVETKICFENCKIYQVITLFNPTEELIEKYKPDYIILSSLDYEGDDPPRELWDESHSTQVSFYQEIRDKCNSKYSLIKIFDNTYFNQWFYIGLDKRFRSYYPSPRIEVYKLA